MFEIHPLQRGTMLRQNFLEVWGCFVPLWRGKTAEALHNDALGGGHYIIGLTISNNSLSNCGFTAHLLLKCMVAVFDELYAGQLGNPL